MGNRILHRLYCLEKSITAMRKTYRRMYHAYYARAFRRAHADKVFLARVCQRESKYKRFQNRFTSIARLASAIRREKKKKKHVIMLTPTERAKLFSFIRTDHRKVKSKTHT